METQLLHSWDLTPKESVLLQRTLAGEIKIEPLGRTVRYVAGTDISCTRGDSRLFAACVVLDVETLEVIEVATQIQEASFPYVPGLLSFREIPALLETFKKLAVVPDLVICDGQGIAHPRGIGLASHLGLWLQIPTIGCAKTRLVGEFQTLGAEKEAETELLYKEKRVGSVFRSKKGTKPLFLSPGHLIDAACSVQWVKRCLKNYRLPEPTRQAHLAVNRLRLENALSKPSTLCMT